MAMPTSLGARLSYTLDRESQQYKDINKQRTAVERNNSQAAALGNPPCPTNGSGMMLRGGAWSYYDFELSVTFQGKLY
jgi:hypothetical protein